MKIGYKILIWVIAFFVFLAGVITLMAFLKPDDGTQEGGTEEITEEETDAPPLDVADGDDFNYAIVDDGKSCIVLGLSVASGARAIEIPSSYEGIPVTAVADSAFSSDINLTSLTLPDTLTHIGSRAFNGCINLTDVTVSKNLEYVGSDAFGSCSSIKYTEYDNALYLGSTDAPYTLLMSAKDTRIEACDIHEDTKVIYELAFADCTEVDKLLIPSTIRQIGIEAFMDCYDLEYTTYEEVRYLGNEENPYLICFEAINKRNADTYILHEDTEIIYPAAFHECEKLTDITIPSKVRLIGAFAFDGCPSLAEVSFEGVSEWTVINGEDILSFTRLNTNRDNMTEFFTGADINSTLVKD